MMYEILLYMAGRPYEITTIMTDTSKDPMSLLKPSAPGEEKKWYEVEPAEGHRFLGEVLQLKSRREIIRFIGTGTRSREEIERQFGLAESVAEVHLFLLEKAVVIEKTEGGYRLTPIGAAYLENFRQFAPNTKRDTNFTDHQP
jgi:DNA-binding transcriptional ArsR family regulator